MMIMKISKKQAAQNLADSAQSLVNAINHYESVRGKKTHCQKSFRNGILLCEKDVAEAMGVMKAKFTK